jgi:hypothetical protein
MDKSLVPGLVLSRMPTLRGENVESYGYPLMPPPVTDPETGRLVFDLTGPRLLKGYVMRNFEYRPPGRSGVASSELDMPAPEGLSGAPMVRADTAEVLGVIYGVNEVAKIDSLAYVDERTGERRPEIQRLVTFGLAHYTEPLWQASGPATDGRPLQEAHDEHVAPGR